MDQLASEIGIDEIVGPCPLCGTKHHYSSAEVEQMIATDGVLAGIDTDLHRYVRGLGRNVTCMRCIIDQQHASAAERRRRKVEELIRRTYREGLIPTIAKTSTHHESKTDIEAQNADAWAKFRAVPLEKSLWVFGHPGTGKTFAARCVLNAYLDLYRKAAEISAHRVNELGKSFRCEKELTPYAEANILLIEDIDKPAWHADGVSALWRLCDTRRTGDRRCIITSNLDPGAVKGILKLATPGNQTIVSSMFDRLMPMERVEMQGENLRRAE